MFATAAMPGLDVEPDPTPISPAPEEEVAFCVAVNEFELLRLILATTAPVVGLIVRLPSELLTLLTGGVDMLYHPLAPDESVP